MRFYHRAARQEQQAARPGRADRRELFTGMRFEEMHRPCWSRPRA
jgi:hypothetical protein